MSSRSKRRGMPAVAVLATAGLAVAGLGGPAQAAAPSAAKPPAAKPSAAKDVRVTLITGDRVVLPGGDPTKATVEPGAGREKVGFNTYRTKDHAYVIPADVTKAVGDGQLDRRLFDVKELVADGYDDASSKVIPVLATYPAGVAKRAVPAGAKVTRQLPSIGGVALSVDKKNATTFLGTSATARSAGGYAKLWLDGKRHITLDQSVPQIGGPVAWQAGYTGKGVKVAVLDTGIDATHPDLATQVAGEKNFTTESSDDVVGHGTHVASTIAGTGAASDGKYKGVAPDAKLYDGKICEVYGCEESAILAGMDWAANDVKADIVNMSLGGTDTPELDPLEEAVNRLTAETGTLFVIAAGNDGPSDRTVGSPGSADAALTVGNVTKQDALNILSSRGPRVGDGAVKPDVTAPGTDIVAAKSKDSSIGEPVGDKYLRLSGTSMATPHTAGAAAILLQEHPAWTPGELKNTLMGSAKVAAEQTTFQQGAGRIDLTTAIKANVIATEGSVSFGVASYPHTDDEPVTKTVTYRNLGDQAVTLDLVATLNGPDGTAAPAGALSLSANSVTVPAGGTASVQVTSNTKHTGTDGLYSGRITATGSGQKVVVPIGVDKEVPTYTLTVKLIRPDGAPDPDYPMTLLGVDNPHFETYSPDATGTVSLRLAKGEYLLSQFQEFERAPEDWIFFTLVAPSVKLDSDQTVVLDARKAKPVTTSVPRADAVQANASIGFDRTIKDGVYWNDASGFMSGEMFTYSTGPALPATELTGHITSQWGVPGADGLFTNTPYLYGIANSQPGVFPTGFDRKVKASDLATVDHTVNATNGVQVQKTITPIMPGVGGVFVRVIRLDLPRTIRYYLDQTPGGWSSEVQQPAPEPSSAVWSLDGDPVVYKAGRTYREQWNTAAFGPSVLEVRRTADKLYLDVGNYTDADGHGGWINTTSASTTLYRDGTQVGTSPGFGFVNATGLPAEKASYKLVTTGTQTLTPFATRVDLTATFTSAADQPSVPIYTVSYQPDVDAHNVVKRQPVTVLPFKVKGGPVKTLTVEYSSDAGTTWHKATVVGSKVVFKTPAGNKISLRSTAADNSGNTTTQTVITAYTIS
ncbi:S8 family serine peptidase [Kribbella sp. NPDC051952]|uniref:S8 family serine peptidase n=1 Tax=Kribbella sp. NPDC051952 TaxID=3154851 RepID=UPI0034204F87